MIWTTIMLAAIIGFAFGWSMMSSLRVRVAGSWASVAAIVAAIVAGSGSRVPVNTALPSVTGTAMVGQAVTCNVGSWRNLPTSYAYTWKRNGSALSGQTASTFALTAPDSGQAVGCSVVASNSRGSSSPADSATVTVAAAPSFTCGSTISSGANIRTALSAAAAGSTVCLNAGTYTYSGAALSKATMTTARAAPGVTRSQITVSNGVDVLDSNNLAFQSMTSVGAGIGTATATATNIQFSDVVFTDGVCVNLPGTNSSRGILIDSSDFPNVPNAGCGNEGRLQFNGRNTSHTNAYHQGVTVSNSYFHGPTTGSSCTDMIQVNGDASGVDITSNEFTSLKESACGVIHGDPIQFYGAAYTTIDGNFIHDSSTGLMNGDCNGNPVTLTNNVFKDGGEISANTFRMTGAGGDVIRHNTLMGAPITFGTPNCLTHAAGETITDNSLEQIDTQNSATYSGTVDYNLSPSSAARGTHGVNGTPTWVGGSNPTTFAGFALASGSAGKGVASDGTDMGVNP